MIKGSVLSQENQPRLIAARHILGIIKEQKLEARNEKNKGHSWDFHSILTHLKDEVRELEEAPNAFEALRELADISNMVDIAFMALVNHMEDSQP